MSKFYVGQTTYKPLVLASDGAGFSALDWRVPPESRGGAQVIRSIDNRCFRVLVGSCEIKTPHQTFSLVTLEAVLIPAGVRCEVRNTSRDVMQLEIIVSSPGLEKFIESIASDKPGQPVPENAADLALRYGQEFHVPESAPQPIEQPFHIPVWRPGHTIVRSI